MIFMGLIYNIALLMTMAMIQQVMTGNALLMRVRRYPGLNSIIWGLVYGGLGLVAMMTPVIFTPGIIFDGRSIILAVAGLFGGPVTAVVAAGMCGAYRLWLGGAGAAMGVSVIIEAAALGVTWRYLSRRHPRLMNGLPLLGFGLAVHLVMIGLMILLPKEVRWDVVARISLPVLVLYPIATMFICRLFLEQEERQKSASQLAESEERYKSLFENRHTVMLIIDPGNGLITDANPAAVAHYGWSREEFLEKTITEINTLTPEETQAEMQLALAEKRNYFLFKHCRADGTGFDVEVYSGPIFLEGKKYLYSIIHDVTDRIEAEKKLKDLNKELKATKYLVEEGLQTSERSRLALLSVLEDEKLAEQAIAEERQQLLSIFGGMSEIVYIADSDTHELLYANDAFKKAFGDKVGNKCHKMLQNQEIPCSFCTNQYIFGSHAGETYVWEFQNEVNKLWYRCIDRAIRWSDGRLVRFEMAIDITESKKAEENMLASLKEKEVMLKEIHHRVKNNLQIIASLLNLQTGFVKDEKYKKMFLESQNRVRAMALVHEKLYKSKNLARIDFAEYVVGLIEEQYQAHGVSQEQVSLEINISEKNLSLDTAIPCGLLINELVSNSFKYAFKDRKGRGKIAITLHKNKDGVYKLEVGDNGVGLKDDFDSKSTSTLGLQLVDALVEQLDGKLEISKAPGAKFVIAFKA